MKILVLCPVYKRPEIFRIHLTGMKRLIDNIKYKISPFYIVSPEDCYLSLNTSMIKSHGFDYCIYKNLPVAEKQNAGINLCMESFKFDYLMNIGSDDIINPELLDLYRPYFRKQEPFFGIDNLYFHDYLSGRCIFFRTYNNDQAIGAGRMIHYRVLKEIYDKGFNLYPNEISCGMDTLSGKLIKEVFKFEEKVINVDDYPYVLDIKTPTNINNFMFLEKIDNKVTKTRFNNIKKYFYG